MRAKKSRNRGRLPTVFTTKSSFASSSTSMVHPPSVGPPFYPRRKEGGSIMATRSAKNGTMSAISTPEHTKHQSILVTGAAGQLGAVGRTVTGLLLERGLPVRALVRREDDRAAALRAAGAEVVVGDLLEPAD